MLILTVKENALVGFRNEENNYQVKEEKGEQAATINGTVLELPLGITHIGNKSDNQINGFYPDKTPEDNDLLLSDDAVSVMRSITSIRLPSSVTTIKCNFFNYFPNLQRIVFSKESHITNIYPRAFADCKKLEELVIPEHADGEEVKIYVDAFVGCSNLKTIDIPENSSIHLASEEPFKGCDNLETLNIRGKAYKFPLLEKNIDKLSHNSDDLRYKEVITFGLARDNYHKQEPFIKLGDDFKLTKSKLKRLSLPSNLKSISGSKNFDGLEEIHLNDELESIEHDALRPSTMKIESNNIKDGILYSRKNALLGIVDEGKAIKNGKLIIPNGVVKLSECAFKSCNVLTSIKIPDSVTNIGNEAFYNCSRLIAVEIPDGVTTIGVDVFCGCTALESIIIPEGVTKIDENAFRNCRALTSIKLPHSLTYIGYGAFWNCTRLASINLPDGITSIDKGAFFNCSKLTSIEIPNSLTSIGNGVFSNCSGLTVLTIPEGVTGIGIAAFENCSGLTELTIPDSVTSIGYCAFQKCKGLKRIICPNGIKKMIQDNIAQGDAKMNVNHIEFIELVRDTRHKIQSDLKEFMDKKQQTSTGEQSGIGANLTKKEMEDTDNQNPQDAEDR